MLKNKRLRLAGLLALLVVLLAGGGGLFFFFSREEEGKTQPPKTQEVETAPLEMSYTASSHERPVEYWLDGTLLFWEDQLMVVSKDQVLDYATHQPVATLPRAIAAYEGLEEGENRPSALCLGENGEWIVLYAGEETGEAWVQRFSWEGEEGERITLSGLEGLSSIPAGQPGEGVYLPVNKMQSWGKKLLIQGEKGKTVQVFDAGGQRIDTWEALDFSVGPQGDLFRLFSAEGGLQLCRFSGQTGEKIFSAPVQGIPTQIFAGEEQIWLLDASGIRAYSAENGEGGEEVFNLAKHAQAGGAVANFALLSDGAVCLTTAAQEGYGMVDTVYRPQWQAPQEITSSITLTAPYYDSWMAEVIHRYMRENPGRQVVYDYAYTSYKDYGSHADRDQYFTKQNTQILAGDVGGLLWMGGEQTDVYSISRTDLFTDLAPLLEESGLDEKLAPAALEGSRVGEEQFFIPLTGAYYCAQLNTALVNQLGLEIGTETTWGQLLDMVPVLEEKAPDTVLFQDVSRQRLLIRILISNMPDLISPETGEVNLQQDWFIHLLEKLKEVWDSPCFFQDGFGTQEKNVILHTNLRTLNQAPKDSAAKYQNDGEAIGGEISYLPLFCGEKGSNRTATSAQFLLIPRSSGKQEEAWDFLSWLLSEECQASRVNFNYPMEKEAREQVLEQAAGTEETGQRWKNDMEQVMEEVDWVFDMYKLKEDLFPPIESWLNGQETLEEALEEARWALFIRLNE